MDYLTFRAGPPLYNPNGFFKRLVILFTLSVAVSATGMTKFLPLESERFREVRSKGCVFFHAWASWCLPCLNEMPEVVKLLNSTKKVTPIILDLSTPFVQESFSKKFMQSMHPQFPLYLKPVTADDGNYAPSWSKTWHGELPFSELYYQGLRRASWPSQTDVSKFRAAIAAMCK